jgi:hypothetical protein
LAERVLAEIQEVVTDLKIQDKNSSGYRIP